MATDRSIARVLACLVLPEIEGYVKVMKRENSWRKTSIEEMYQFADEVAPRYVELILSCETEYEVRLSKILHIEIRKLILKKINEIW